jgi:tetratricopeptide (TPR) repeat protein
VAYIKGIELAEKNKYTGYSLGILKANLSQIYLDYYKKHNIAIELLNEAIENYDKNEVISSKEHAYRNISYNYTALKDFQKAIFYANRAIEIANEVKDPHRKVMAYSALHHAQKMAGMYKESLENLEFVNHIEDSLFSMEKTGILAEMDAKFETVKKDAQIEILSSKAKLDTLQKRALWAGILMLLSIGVFIIKTQADKSKKQKFIAEQEIAIQHEKLKNTELELEFKQKELTSKILQLARKNEFLNELENEVKLLKTNVDGSVNKASTQISKLIKRDASADQQWEQFSAEFGSLHKGFLDALQRVKLD